MFSTGAPGIFDFEAREPRKSEIWVGMREWQMSVCSSGLNRRSAYTRRANKDAAASCERFMNTGRRAAAAPFHSGRGHLFLDHRLGGLGLGTVITPLELLLHRALHRRELIERPTEVLRAFQ